MTTASTGLADTVDSVIETLAERLADPARTCPCGSAENWRPALDSECGLALLYAELGHSDPDYRYIAHRYLGEANQALSESGNHALYDGAPALAFAASCAVQREGEYATLFAGLDEPVFRVVRVVLAAEHERLKAGATAEHYANFDLISGLAGLGRYLLRREQDSPEARSLLEDVCAYFGALIRPIKREGHTLPGWWSDRPLNPSTEDSSGHINLGMAHGIPGPLALLATAWRSGVRVHGHAEAIETIMDFLITWSDEDEFGRYWPQALDLDEYTHRPPRLTRSRQAWCYGTPGIARAVQLAGFALGRQDWNTLAREAVWDMFRLPTEQWRVQDTCLCHGWAGLLHVVARIHADDPRCELSGELDWLAQRTAAPFDPSLPYGYQQVGGLRAELLRDDPGFLTGAAGIALALHAYRTTPRPASGWDTALLLD
ncbi:lanthionine synthetase C family protein [Sciscionella marina]|uniref:lanthionine synthetase C family protein n=1 Tax=Sciscionella marina TaxID=508770 RepID=UPI0003665E44|nr:lanthionine synthetase C family protein [Sciscionella marina]